MRLSSWLRSVRSPVVSDGAKQGDRPSRSAKRTPSPRLSVEPLEDRVVPSTFTVDNLADSGPGSLRAAIVAANTNPGADVIYFAPRVRGRNLDKVDALRPIADRLGTDLATLALRWVAEQQGVTAAIAGSRNPDHVRANAGTGELRVDDKAMEEIEARDWA